MNKIGLPQVQIVDIEGAGKPPNLGAGSSKGYHREVLCAL
jgi:hypothetical protein